MVEQETLKFGYIEELPENIREMFTIICQNLNIIQGKWDLYNILFDEKNSTVLNSLASYAFLLIKDSLYENIILGICRFGDNDMMIHNRNVGFKTLVTKCSTVPDLDKYYQEFLILYGPFKNLRDKHIAHTDYAVHIGDPEYHLWLSSYNLPLPEVTKGMIEEILIKCSNFLNVIATHYSGKNLEFHPISLHDGKALMYWLNYSYKMQTATLNKSENNE